METFLMVSRFPVRPYLVSVHVGIGAQLAMRGIPGFGDPVVRYGRASAVDGPFKPYLDGMLADTTPGAIEQLRKSTEVVPYHFASRHVLALSLFSLAEFDQSLEVIVVAKELFDDDVDFRLLEGLVHSAKGDLSAADFVLSGLSLPEETLARWNKFCHFVHFVTQDMHIDRGMADLNLASLAELGTRFESEFYDLIKDRQWVLPPNVSRKFAELPSELHALAGQPDEDTTEWLEQFTKTHPEGSLHLLLGTSLFSRIPGSGKSPGTSIPLIQSARVAFRKAATVPMFVNDTKVHAQLGDLTASLLLGSAYQTNVEQNMTAAVDTARQIEIPATLQLSTARTISLLLLRNGLTDDSEPWVREWCRLAGDDVGAKVDALWHQGILHKQRGDWLDVVEVCDQISRIDPEKKYIDAVGFRDSALRKLRNRIPDLENSEPKADQQTK